MSADRQLTEAAIRQIAEAVEIVSETEFTLRGKRHSASDIQPSSSRVSRQAIAPLIYALRQKIYHSFYTKADSADESIRTQKESSRENEVLLEELKSANQSRTAWDEHWRVQRRLSDGSVVAMKGNRAQIISPGQYVFDAAPRKPQSNDIVRTLAQGGSPDSQTGFYFIYGETAGDLQDRDEVFRIYWNTTANGAALVARELSARFNRWQIPFHHKCPVTESAFRRVDSGVSYVPARYLELVANSLRDILPRVANEMQPETPIFTRRIAPGLSVAENPPDGASFGMTLCGIVAEGLRNAHSHGHQTAQSRQEHIERHFLDCGLSLGTPWLRRAGRDVFGLGELEL